MKIGIDVRLWNQSGVGRYVRNLVIELQKLDKKNEYVLFVRSDDYESVKFQISNFKFQIVKVDIRWHTLAEQILLPAILNKEDLDLVHFPYFSVPIFYNKLFVITIHDLILHHFPTGEASTLFTPFYYAKLLGYKYIIAQAAKAAKKIITVSHATEKEIIDHLGVDERKIVVTYEGVDTSSLRAKRSNLIENGIATSSFDMLRTPRNDKYFLYVGNAYPHKNLNRLVEAFAECENDIKLVLVGKEDYFYKKLQQKVAQLNVKEMVLFAGEVSDEELTNLYKNARALIVPSSMEGFGLPGLEAMANKCLVLASDIPVHREIYKDAPVYFNPNSTEELADKMKSIHLNDIYHYSGNIKAGLERSTLFSWEKMAKETLKVYEGCINLR